MGLLWNGRIRKDDISRPFNFEHRIHAEIDTETGEIRGLPKQWKSVMVLDRLYKRGPFVVAERTTSNTKDRTDCTSLYTVPSSSNTNPGKKYFTRSNSLQCNGNNLINNLTCKKPKPSITIEDIKHTLRSMSNPNDPRNDLCNIKELGNGSTCRVSQAYMASMRRNVAVKRMSIQNQQRPELLINEIEVMKRCNHPNMIQLYSCHLVNEELWLCMELAPGGSLTTFLSKKRLSEVTIATVSKQCLSALHYLHSNRIIHRDIKSDSILFSSQKLVKLSDFGFASILTDNCPKRRSLLGTPYWLAPEVALSEFYDFSIDIWSFGITIIEMICGEPPYYEEEPAYAIELIKEHPPPKIPDEYCISIDLCHFLECILVREPNFRWPALRLLQHPFMEKSLVDPTMIEL